MARIFLQPGQTTLTSIHATIQTSSYNFTRTNTTGEVCIGLVKAPPIHCKNPAQHYSD